MEQTLIVKQFNNQLLHSCSYIIDGDFLILIDPGEFNPLIDYVKDSGKNLRAILLTHCHADHIYGLEKIFDLYPDLPVYCSYSTSIGIYNNKQNLSFTLPDSPINISKSLNIKILAEGEFKIDDLKVKVLETPGHSDDCLSYIIGSHIFTGDSYIPFSKVFTKWPRSQKALATENEAKLKSLVEEYALIVHPGHWQ